MKKGLITTFIIVGILVLALVIWAIVFGGGLQSVITAVITPINDIWNSITGQQYLIDPAILDQDNADANNLNEATTVFG